MADRDKYGNYVNDKGVTIKINTDKNGNDHWTCKINVDTKKRSTFFCYNKIGGRIWQELEKNQIDIGQKKISWK